MKSSASFDDTSSVRGVAQPTRRLSTPADAWPAQPREVTSAIRRVHLAAGDADHAIARRMALRPTDMAAMIHVSSGPSIGPSELADRLAITPAATTELIDRLAAAGHVQREPDPRDRRRVRLRPGDATRNRVLAELAPLIRALDAGAEAFSTEEQAVIARYLAQVAAIMTDFADDNRGAR